MKSALPDATSLDQPIGSGEDASELGFFIEDEREPEVGETVAREMESGWLEEAVEHLPERHREVLIRRYGLDDRDKATLATLSDEMSISRERVRQLQREAELMIRRNVPSGAAA